MKTQSKAARLIPAMLVAAATAIPAATAVDLMTHASASTSLVAAGPAASGSLALGGSPAAAGSGSTTYNGIAEQNQYGTVQATLVVTGNTITNVIISAPQDNPRSASINSYAVPILVSETLRAQSAQVNAVSGATYTSESYIGSLQAALAAAHL